MKFTFNTFYKQYIPEAQIHELIDLGDVNEVKTGLEYVQRIMNFAVWQLSCQLLDPKEYSTFFSLQQSNFADESLIDWLQERCPEITILLPEVLERSILAILAEIRSNEKYDNS